MQEDYKNWIVDTFKYQLMEGRKLQMKLGDYTF